MTSKRTTRPTVKFLGTVDELPEATIPKGHNGAPYWNDLAAGVKASPAVWHKVDIPNLSTNAKRAGASAINKASRDGDGGILAFREPGYRAAFRDNVLHVRYDQPAKVRSIGKRAS